MDDVKECVRLILVLGKRGSGVGKCEKREGCVIYEGKDQGEINRR